MPALDPNRHDLTLGIVGAGVMGRGIAQIAAEAGIRVLLTDSDPQAVHDAIVACRAFLERKVAKGQIKPADARRAIGLIMPSDGYAGFAPCDLVIEAVSERPEIKQAVLKAVEANVGEDCIIATNTSSLSVTALATNLRGPRRMAGFHFFNPVPLMKLVEIIGGARTENWVLEALSALAKRMGHRPVASADTPGFIVNHAGRAYGTEALRILSEGVCDPADIDRIMVEAAGFKMGPFELFDLTGIDVSHPATEAIYRRFYEEPRLRPSPIAAQQQQAGFLGRKSSRGFYRYEDGKAVKPAETVQSQLAAWPVWISGRYPDASAMVHAAVEATGIRIEDGERPFDAALILVTPFGEDCTTAALAEGLDPRRTIAIDCLFGLAGRRTLMRNPATSPEFLAHAAAIFAQAGASVTCINDSAGFVAQRITAAIVNLGCEIAQQRIATPGDLEIAMQLGLGYRRGALTLGDHLGPARILHILDRIYALSGDPRYRPSPWLRRRAKLELSLLASDMADQGIAPALANVR